MVKLWESKNAQRALKGSGLTLMAMSLTACGGEDITQAQLDAQVALAEAAAAAQAAAEAEAAAQTIMVGFADMFIPSILAAQNINSELTRFVVAAMSVTQLIYMSEVGALLLGSKIPVNIFDLGLIYTIDIDAENAVRIIMTLTAPGCPVAGDMPGWVADAVEPVDGVKHVDVELTWEPQWGMDMMSDEARLELGFM